MNPNLWDIVNYTNYPVKWKITVRPAMITEVADAEKGYLTLCVFNTTDLSFVETISRGTKPWEWQPKVTQPEQFKK